jgi:hypothetical protein
VVALLWFMAGTAASAQTGPGVGYDRAALTQAICRQYAAAQRGTPYDTMYASCRVLRFIMEMPDRAVSKRR